eukprot:10977347-Lingulodinium_polyedra.AAC.1
MESTVRRRSDSVIARSRAPCAGQKLVCAGTARACDLRAAAAADGRSDRVVVQRFANVAQRPDRID